MKNTYFLDCEWISDNYKIVKKPEIISVGIVKINEAMEIEDSFYRLIKPNFNNKLPKFTTKLTGITIQDLQNGISFETCLKEMEEWIGDLNNCRIYTWGSEDKLMFKRNNNMQKIKNEITKYFIDIQPDLSNKIRYNEQYISNQFSLSDMLKIFKSQQSNAHNALGDAQTLANIYKMIKKQYSKDEEYIKYLFFEKYKKSIIEIKSCYFSNCITKENLVTLKNYLICTNEAYKNIYKIKKDKVNINDKNYLINDIMIATYVKKQKNTYIFSINIFSNSQKLTTLTLKISQEKKLKTFISILENFK